MTEEAPEPTGISLELVATAIAGVFANFANKIGKITREIRGCR